MRITKLLLLLCIAALPILSTAETPGGLDPAVLVKSLGDTWPTYSGDYTGRRFSSLTQINRNTVKNLTLSWVARLSGTAGSPQTILGGVGSGEYTNVTVKGFVLYFDETLYVTSADHVWALDPRDGRLLWHYFWRTRGGTHTGNRGVALWHNYLYFETPDDYLVSLDSKTGKERWHIEIADFDQQYFSTMAPVVVGNHLLVGTGNDLDAPGFLQSFDPETGKLQWKFYTVPMNAGDPGLETWPSLDAARHGGGQVWIPGSYDPETKLYIFGTGNPTPGYTGVGRKGDNLFTCSLVAVNVDTGKMAWYFQTSVHDTHDWDSTQTPVLIDGVINGRPRKLVSTAERNGYFYTLDRVTGEHIVTAKYGSTTNWGKSLRPNGVVEPDPLKEATVSGSLVSPVESGVTNWPPPAYAADTGLFYVPEHNGFNMLYLTDPDPRGSMGLGGKSVAGVGSAGDFLTAIDYKTGRVAWRKPISGGGVGAGLLATAGGLLFAGDGSGNLMALDSRDGKALWHTRIGNASNAPQTYLLDGRQQLLIAVGDTLYAFNLY
jgi:alcohol dehydrogenase (cytochrome c)